MRNLRRKLLLVIVGIVCCSMISSYISFNLGFPFGVPELLIFLFLPFYFKDFSSFFNCVKKNIIEIFLIFFLLLSLSFINKAQYLPEVLSTSRSIFLLLIFYFYGRNVNAISLQSLFYISFGAVLGTYLNTILNFNEDRNYSFNNTLAFSIFVIYPLIKRQFKLFFICLIFSLYIAVSSAMRRQIIELFLTVSFGTIALILIDKSKVLYKILTLITILIISGFYIIPLARDYFKETNYFIYSRIFEKTDDTLQHGIEEEGTRAEHFPNLGNYISNTLIPKGFYPRNISFKVGTGGGATFDFPMYEICYTLGSILGCIIIIILLFRILFFFRKIVETNKPDYYNNVLIFLIPSIIIFACMFFDGGFLHHNFITPFTGLTLGLLFRKYKSQIFY